MISNILPRIASIAIFCSRLWPQQRMRTQTRKMMIWDFPQWVWYPCKPQRCIQASLNFQMGSDDGLSYLTFDDGIPGRHRCDRAKHFGLLQWRHQCKPLFLSSRCFHARVALFQPHCHVFQGNAKVITENKWFPQAWSVIFFIRTNDPSRPWMKVFTNPNLPLRNRAFKILVILVQV